MVWHFTGVYIINRTLHGRLEIRNFSLTREIFFLTREEKFRISARPCKILYLFFGLYEPSLLSLYDRMFTNKKVFVSSVSLGLLFGHVFILMNVQRDA